MYIRVMMENNKFVSAYAFPPCSYNIVVPCEQYLRILDHMAVCIKTEIPCPAILSTDLHFIKQTLF